mmetsp:Transcript_21345/g.39877  ORF Transcript_21345/g.39877 Transcript_21345/m.39877 type:complete len:275 (+) Transcript_21345:313-1137(+)
MDDVSSDVSPVGPVEDEAIDAIAVADVVLQCHLAMQVCVLVPCDIHPHPVNDVVLGCLAVPALPRTLGQGVCVFGRSRVARGDGATVEPTDGTVIPVIVGVVIWDLVDVSIDLIPRNGHLDGVGGGVDSKAFGEHDGRLGAGTPPRVIVHDRISDADVITLVDAHARSGAVVHDHVAEGDVIALPNCHAAGGVLDERRQRVAVVDGLLVGDFGVGALDFQPRNVEVGAWAGAVAYDSPGAIKLELWPVVSRVCLDCEPVCYTRQVDHSFVVVLP